MPMFPRETRREPWVDRDSQATVSLHLGEGLAHRGGGLHDKPQDGHFCHADLGPEAQGKACIAGCLLRKPHERCVLVDRYTGIGVVEVAWVDVGLLCQLVHCRAPAGQKGNKSVDDACGDGRLLHYNLPPKINRLTPRIIAHRPGPRNNRHHLFGQAKRAN